MPCGCFFVLIRIVLCSFSSFAFGKLDPKGGGQVASAGGECKYLGKNTLHPFCACAGCKSSFRSGLFSVRTMPWLCVSEGLTICQFLADNTTSRKEAPYDTRFAYRRA